MGPACSSKQAVAVSSAPSDFCSCIDGREHGDMFGVPGGDAGIILRCLLAYAEATGEEVTPELVAGLLQEIVKVQKRPIYLHSDDHAMEHCDITARKEEGEMDQLCEAANIGCGYFKLAMTSPESLGPIASDKIQSIACLLYKSLCQYMWSNPDGIRFVTLHGDHAEDAVYVTDSLTNKLDADGHIFIYHPKYEEMSCGQCLDVLSHVKDISPSREEINSRLAAINEQHWTTAIGILAPGVEHEKKE